MNDWDGVSERRGTTGRPPLHPEAVERLTRIETLIEASTGTSRDHEKRIRTLERHSWTRAGAAGALAAVGAWFAKQFTG